MRCLTLWPEWAWAICYLGKPWENRPRPASWYGIQPGVPFAIHGGAHLGGRSGIPAALEGLGGVKAMAERAGVTKLRAELYGRNPSLELADGPNYRILSARHYPAQQVVAVVTMDRCEWNGGDVRVELRDALARSASEGWRVPGQYGFHLGEVKVLPEPVSCTVAEYPGNRQGLWTLPAPVERRVRELLPRAA